MRRPIVLALLLTVALVAAACGSGGDDSVQTEEPTAAPTPTAPPADDDGGDDTGSDTDGADDITTTDPDDGAPDDSGDAGSDADTDAGGGGDADGDGTDTTDPPDNGDVEVIFALFTTGGFVPVDVALSEFPQLVVQSDGTAYVPGAQIAIFPPPLTPALERRQLSADEVAAIRAAVEASGVIDAEQDFGIPNVTDTPFTRVTAPVGGQLVEVEAYALGFTEGLSDDARDARAALTALIDEVTAIVDSAFETGTLTAPPALGVLTFPSLAYQENDPVRPWPIESVPQPAPPGADCVVVTGAELNTLWEAASDATTQTPWSIAGETKAVAFRPVFPHETFC